MTVKLADDKGRISLGSRFANQTVILEDVDPTEVRVILAQVVPLRELWLHENPTAKASVLRGLAQAKVGVSVVVLQKGCGSSRTASRPTALRPQGRSC